MTSDRVHFVVLACEEGGRWGPDVFAVVNDLVRLKVAPVHPLLRRSAALAYTRRWWSILAMGAQTAAIDCILGKDPQVWVPQESPPLASVRLHPCSPASTRGLFTSLALLASLAVRPSDWKA